MNPYQEKISSINVILRSIDKDYQVYRWFSYLIITPLVANKIKTQPLGSILLKKIYNYNYIHLILLLLLVSSLIFSINQIFFISFASIISLLCLIIHSNKKSLVVQTTKILLESTFTPGGLEEKTLYQISEILSHKYSTPSLVDLLYNADQLMRKSILVLYILICSILPLNFRQICLVTVTTYLIVYLISNSNVMIRRLK